MEYAKIPKTIDYTSIMKRGDFCLSPSKYIQVNTTNNKNIKFEILSNLVKLKTPSKSIVKDKTITYIEIGDINVENGSIEYKKIETYKLPKSNIRIEKGDILISKVRTYRGGIGIVNINQNSIFSTSAFIVITDTINIDKNYLYAILRSKYFIEQIQTFENRGMYPRLDNDTIDKVKIPIPINENTIQKISLLTQSLINKERKLREKFKLINKIIESELKNNQGKEAFSHKVMTYKDLLKHNRFDTGIYTKEFKETEYLISNYKNGSDTITNLGFYSIRGQNLAISVIGKSIYSDSYKSNFYQLFLPTHISRYGMMNKIVYFGNSLKLIPIKNEDIIFGAEGFEKGRSHILTNREGKLTTNYHGTILRHDNEKLHKKIFIKCMLDWFREKGVIDAYAVGGNGGSFSTKYWKVLHFPLFDDKKQKEIAKLYYNPSENSLNHISIFDLKTYLDIDFDLTKNSGILDLDLQIKTIKKTIDNEIKKMIS